MQEPRSGMRTAEKAAGVIAVVAALVVLNGAWVNQHNWENISWRVAIAAVLVVLAILVETNAFGFLRFSEREEDVALPDFMRNDAPFTTDAIGESDPTRADPVKTADRR